VNQNFDCEATASMLDSGRVLALASQVAALIAAISPWNSLAHRVLFAAVLLLWPLVCWLAIRVAIDASLFRAMAKDPDGTVWRPRPLAGLSPIAAAEPSASGVA
jgi:hypothetical protein